MTVFPMKVFLPVKGTIIPNATFNKQTASGRIGNGIGAKRKRDRRRDLNKVSRIIDFCALRVAGMRIAGAVGVAMCNGTETFTQFGIKGTIKACHLSDSSWLRTSYGIRSKGGNGMKIE